MTFIYFIKLLSRNLLWLIVIPVTLAGSIFYFTRYQKKVYLSESVIYTGIASGYSLSGNNKADFFETSNAFDNLLSLINSRETRQEVLIALLSNHLMMKGHNPAVMSWDAYQQLKQLIPESLRNQLVQLTDSATRSSIRAYMTSREGNVIYSLFNSKNPYYSLDAMENVKAIRINNSDLIKLSYQTNDPAICKQTLELLEEAFIKKHRMLKEGQSESVVDYFETETHKAFSRLNEAEQSFLDFNKQNDIINYYEQTKAVAVEKENLDVQNHNMQMDKMATGSSLEKINENIKSRLYQNEYGNQILANRQLLSGVYNQIAVGEIAGKSQPGHQVFMDSLRNISQNLEKKLAGSVNNMYLQNLTPNGIPTKDVLEEWLKNSLAFEQSKARLAVMDERKKQFEKEYKRYAPLGATLKKIERQINVSEQEYLELLHGLNMAKLTQQNNELTTKLNIVDAPYLPLKANPSTRILQIVAGSLVGFLLVLASILMRALINKTVQQPEKALKIIGIPIFGTYPLLNENPDFISKANLRLTQQLLSQVDPGRKPSMIGVLSVQKKEGKSTITDVLVKQLRQLDYKVETVTGENIPMFKPETDIVFLEIPPLDTMIIKPGAIAKLDHTILVCRANRIWGKIDKELLAIFIKTTGASPRLLVNGVTTDFAEAYIGEVPKRRFILRQFFKRLLQFEFGNRKQIIQ
jgi:succinoglycan biosynthesis transport protein ExoP